ncbi:MAG TPA: hypothetical protein VEH29_02295 [Acidimicrobiales bacterium]|nr:hypothetical protein [Acidimicrobiales bacterium]
MDVPVPGPWTDQPATIEDLIADASDLGFRSTKRMIYDWVSLGLLDHPARRTRGSGGSEKALWNLQQRMVFRVLVAHRPHVKSISQLAQFPIAFWLHNGDEYVPTRQAVLAVRTWAGRRSNPSWQAARASARWILALLDQPDADPRARRKLVELVARGAHGEAVDRDELLDAIWGVFDQPDEGRVLGVPPLASTPEQIAAFVEARLAGLRVARRVTEEQLKTVWWANQAARPGWEAERPAAADQVTREAERGLFEEETTEVIVNTAVGTVLTLLGLFFGKQVGQDIDATGP